MKRCKSGLFSKLKCIIPSVAMILLLTRAYSFTLRAPSPFTYILFVGALVVVLGFEVLLIYRAFYQGVNWAEYDEETVIFHRSGREQYCFRWEDIPGADVQVVLKWDRCKFTVLTGDRPQKMVINNFSDGFDDFYSVVKSAVEKKQS